MPIHQRARVIAIALAIVVATIACEPGPSPTKIVSVTSVTPGVGPFGVATEIRIKGIGFKPGAGVTMGPPATQISVIDSTTIVARTPVTAQGKVDIVVRNPGGGVGTLPAGFEFLFPLNVFSVSPNKAPAGWWVNVVGKGFLPGVTATFSGVPATSIIFADTKLILTVPLLPAGVYDVIITNPDGESRTLPSAFTFQTVTFSANTGSVAAGGPLSITWDAPFFAPSDFAVFDDWIGLFEVGAPSQWATAFWWRTLFSAKGTLNVTAPTVPGQYEFRYISADTVQAVVSVVVTASADAARRIR